MPYIASNDGLAFRWRDPAENYAVQPGEVDMGADAPNEAALAAAFPGYQNSALAAQSAALAAASVEAVIAADPTLESLRAMDNAAFDEWWAANVTNATQAIGVLKRLAKLVVRRL